MVVLKSGRDKSTRNKQNNRARNTHEKNFTSGTSSPAIDKYASKPNSQQNEATEGYGSTHNDPA
jgi:hypothetical protein